VGTGIQWTDETWNPTVGCDRISPGCARCYAKDLHDKRHKAHLAGKAMAPQYAQPFEVLQTIASRLDAPLRWRKPRKVFVNSVSDLFHEAVPDAFIAEVFGVMAVCGAREPGAPERSGQFGGKYSPERLWYDLKGPHTFQVLTKRPRRALHLLTSRRFRADVASAAYRWAHNQRDAGYLAHQIGEKAEYERCYDPGRMWPLSNVWLGVSVENQHFADERIPLLLQTPAAVRFISAEPLLGAVDLNALPDPKGDPSWDASALHGLRECAFGAEVSREEIASLDWVIVGGESGKGARPCATEWIGSLVAQCRAAAVPVFVKQLGAYVVSEERTASLDHFSDPASPKLLLAPNGEAWAWRAGLRDSHGGDPSEWPEDLRVREFPTVASCS
jgi:protein gp37